MLDNQKLSLKVHKNLAWVMRFTDHPLGMYEGMYFSDAPGQFTKLERIGYVRTIQPHNSIHKLRVVITKKGREYLEKYPITLK